MRAIYAEGIATGDATFQTEAPSWEAWDRTHLPGCAPVLLLTTMAGDVDSNLVAGPDFQSKVEFYFIGLTFTILGFSIQIFSFGCNLFADGLELGGWFALLLSGMTGLRRLDRGPSLYRLFPFTNGMTPARRRFSNSTCTVSPRSSVLKMAYHHDRDGAHGPMSGPTRLRIAAPDSPGQCEPRLSDDRARDPRLCYCPALSDSATSSSSS